MVPEKTGHMGVRWGDDYGDWKEHIALVVCRTFHQILVLLFLDLLSPLSSIARFPEILGENNIIHSVEYLIMILFRERGKQIPL